MPGPTAADVARATEQASNAPLATLVITLTKAGIRVQGSATQDPFFAIGLLELAKELQVRRALRTDQPSGIVPATTLPPSGS